MGTVPTGRLERELKSYYLKWVETLSDGTNLDKKLKTFQQRVTKIMNKTGGEISRLGVAADFPAPKMLDLSLHAGTIYTDMQKAVIQANIAAGLNSREAARSILRAGMDKSYRKLERLARTETVSAYWKNQWNEVDGLGLVMLWSAESGPRTCEWCMEREGLVVTDSSLRDHPNGRCTLIPTMPSRVKYRGSVRSDGTIYWDDDWDKQYRPNQPIIANSSALVPPTEPLAGIPSYQDISSGTHGFNDVFEGQDFNGFSVKVMGDTRGASLDMDILSSDGRVAGHITRTFGTDSDGAKYVFHDKMVLEPEYRGKGFSTAFSNFSEEWYKQSGISQIKLSAALEDGAYTWARAGYAWDPSVYKPSVFDGVIHDKPGVVYHIERLLTEMEAGLEPSAAKYSFPGLDLSTVDAGKLKEWVDRFNKPSVAEWPAPAEIALNKMGKALFKLPNTYWSGVKKL